MVDFVFKIDRRQTLSSLSLFFLFILNSGIRARCLYKSKKGRRKIEMVRGDLPRKFSERSVVSKNVENHHCSYDGTIIFLIPLGNHHASRVTNWFPNVNVYPRTRIVCNYNVRCATTTYDKNCNDYARVERVRPWNARVKILACVRKIWKYKALIICSLSFTSHCFHTHTHTHTHSRVLTEHRTRM